MIKIYESVLTLKNISTLLKYQKKEMPAHWRFSKTTNQFFLPERGKMAEQNTFCRVYKLTQSLHGEESFF
jgi:hypothetical protein